MYNKSDKFDHLIALAAMKCAEEDAKELNELDTSSVKFDPSYYRKRAKMINGRKRRPALKRARTVTLRVAAAIMIISMLGCIMIGCVPEWREAIFGAIIEWYDNCFAVRFETPGGSEPETEPTDTNDGQPTAPTSIEEIRKPTDLPEGVREDILLQNLSTFVVDYYFNDEYLFSFSQRLRNSISQTICSRTSSSRADASSSDSDAASSNAVGTLGSAFAFTSSRLTATLITSTGQVKSLFIWFLSAYLCRVVCNRLFTGF